MTDADLVRAFNEREDAIERLDDLRAATRRYIEAHVSKTVQFLDAAKAREHREAGKALAALVLTAALDATEGE
jgi:hypothetical protein